MIGLSTSPGTWQRELERSRQSLSAVNRFWHGLYGKAVMSPTQALPSSVDRRTAPASAEPPRSMYERVGSRVIDA